MAASATHLGRFIEADTVLHKGAEQLLVVPQDL